MKAPGGRPLHWSQLSELGELTNLCSRYALTAMYPPLCMQAIADLAGELAEAKNGKEHLQGQVEALKEEVKLKDRANQAAQVPITLIMSPPRQLTNCLPYLLFSH